MKREITEYETNNLDTLNFIRWCKYFLNAYRQKKTMLVADIARQIWKMIQEDVFNVNISDFNKLVDDIGYRDFMSAMHSMCYIVDQKEEEYIYDRNFENIDCISLIGKPIYKFMHKIEEMLPYED